MKRRDICSKYASNGNLAWKQTGMQIEKLKYANITLFWKYNPLHKPPQNKGVVAGWQGITLQLLRFSEWLLGCSGSLLGGCLLVPGKNIV